MNSLYCSIVGAICYCCCERPLTEDNRGRSVADACKLILQISESVVVLFFAYVNVTSLDTLCMTIRMNGGHFGMSV